MVEKMWGHRLEHEKYSYFRINFGMGINQYHTSKTRNQGSGNALLRLKYL